MLQNHFRKFAVKFLKYDLVSGQVEPRRTASNIVKLPELLRQAQGGF
jgi:hypothetical protein